MLTPVYMDTVWARMYIWDRTCYFCLLSFWVWVLLIVLYSQVHSFSCKIHHYIFPLELTSILQCKCTTFLWPIYLFMNIYTTCISLILKEEQQTWIGTHLCSDLRIWGGICPRLIELSHIYPPMIKSHRETLGLAAHT